MSGERKDINDIIYGPGSELINQVLEALNKARLPEGYKTFGVATRQADGRLYISCIFDREVAR